MNAHVSVRNLRKTFALSTKGHGAVSLREALRTGARDPTIRSVQALDDLSFEVREGERVGIIGRNGAGKTTLLSILAGIAEPTSGQIDIQGDVHAMLTIGTVLREEATGRENIYLDGAVHGRTREEIDARVERIIAFADIGDFIERPVRTYSSGMKARLAFAMGAFIDPDILIIDETLAVGDAFFADKAMRRIREIAARGRIVFVVSHALASIVAMCDRCIWLDQGRVVMDGDPAEVTRAYERQVSDADEAELARKFASGPVVTVASGRRLGSIGEVVLLQDDASRTGHVRAFSPLSVRIEMQCDRPAIALDLELQLMRVDGRSLWRRRLGDILSGDAPRAKSVWVEVRFDPLLLGAALYGLDVMMMNGVSIVDARRRVFEVIDEEGQFGGAPSLYYPADIRIKSHKADDGIAS